MANVDVVEIVETGSGVLYMANQATVETVVVSIRGLGLF